jgi:uncharacterized protein (DUF697 family)
MVDLPTSPDRPGLTDAAWRELLARAALFTGLATLVPVPFLDDLLVDRTREHLVGSLLRAHGRGAATRRVQALWAGSGCFSTCLGWPFKLVLWPLKKLLKTVFFVLALRSAALQVGRTLALGRAVERRLQAGAFADAPVPAAGAADPLALEALQVRAALDRAYAGIDRVVLVRAFEATLRGARHVPRLVRAAMRRLLRRGVTDEAAAVAALPPEQQQAVAGAVDRVEATLEDPSVRAVLDELDRRFDHALAHPGPA